ncbi:MAG: YceI family protein [Acidobacteriaceae bacterium]|nr:YceI family protein [Acidobacteriaceae bacterium]
MPLGEVLYTILPSPDSTLAIELLNRRFFKQNKHILSFENFRGELSYVADRPEASKVNLMIEAASVTCRDKSLNKKKQALLTRYAKEEGLSVAHHPEIRFASTRISPKPLRGFVVEGVLTVRGIGRVVKLNIVLNPMKYDRFQIDGDTSVRLSDFGAKPPSSLFGLIATKDEALVRLLLWATPA